MKHGGSYKKAKNAFVKQQVSLVKKQAGGAEQAKTNDSDPIGADFRKNKLQAFIGTLKDESAQAKAKEQAEQQFDQMMQQQQMQQYPMAQQGGDPNIYQGQDFENPMHHLALFSQSTGNIFDQDQNQINQAQMGAQIPMRRGLFGRPKMPRGFGFGNGMPPVTKMDVRRTGLFGRPKEYSMEFGMPSVMPGMGFPGMGAGFYGYGQTTKQGGKTKGRIITEEVAKVVNNEATKEVAANTPGSTATNKPNDGTASNTTPGSTASNVQENTGANGERKAIQVNDEETDEVVNNSETTREKKKQKNLYDQGLPGSSYDYIRQDGQWKYWDKEKQDYIKVGNEDSLARLEAGENKSANYVTLPNNPGFYYRKANDGSYIKFKGDPTKHTAQTQPVGKITKKNTVPFNNLEKNQVITKDKDYGYDDLLQFPNAPVEKNVFNRSASENRQHAAENLSDLLSSDLSDFYNYLPDLPSFGGPNSALERTRQAKKQYGGDSNYPFGGFVDSGNPDLYKFIYGGNDIDQSDIDDVYSKDTSDPYFQYGGLTTYQTKGEVKEDDYDKYQREKAEKEALEEYNSYMNRGAGDVSKKIAYTA